MADSATMIYDLAASVMSTIEAAYLAEPLAEPLPDRRYIAEGPPAYDCEQVVVALVRFYPGIPFRENPGLDIMKCTLLRAVTLAVHIVRCIPTLSQNGTPPSVVALNAAARVGFTDTYMLPTSIVRAWHGGTLSSSCDQLGVRELQPAEPSGGYGGVILTLEAQF